MQDDPYIAGLTPKQRLEHIAEIIAAGILRIVEIKKKMTNTTDYPKSGEERQEHTDPASK